ncbi:hypothetical protein VR611_10165 [Aquirufa nivalisilvae]|nr:hypothetical protein [Aquirufa nivalisilvae]
MFIQLIRFLGKTYIRNAEGEKPNDEFTSGLSFSFFVVGNYGVVI